MPGKLRRRKARLGAIQAAKKRLEVAHQVAVHARERKPGQDRNPKGEQRYKRACAEPDPQAQSNFAAPESGIMNTSAEGFQQCYNAQGTVDAEHQLIVSIEVTERIAGSP